MQVRVLGQFEVARGEKRITPSQPKLRQLFALLALNANTVVRAEQLIEELWGPEPPSKAMGTLQTYMSHLRRLLAADDMGVSVLHTRHVGYALTLPEQNVDAGRFAGLVARGRSELDGGHVEAASETFRAALAVWRGSALSDVDAGPVLEHHIRSLEETRVGVIDQRMEVELMLGHHHEVINDLSTLVRDYPAHEGLHVKLMMALHLLGRRSEALHVFQRIRTTLIDDLGLEPGQQLQQVHRGLLVGNPQLDALTPTGALRSGSWLEPPAQLPPDLPVFVGRTAELAAAESPLQQPSRSAPAVVSVVGPPGSGKTAFSTHLAHRVRARFPHGQLHADLAEQTPVEALTGFLRAIRGTGAQLPDSIEERSHLLRGWTAERRVLVLIDNAVSTVELAPLMPSGGGCAVIVSCRTRLPLRGTSLAVDLRPPAEDEALELLGSVIGWRRLRAELPQARRLIRLFEASPMALVAAANRLAVRPHWTIAVLLDRLRHRRDWLDELVNARVDLVNSIELSCRSLAPAHRDAFFRLADAATEPLTTRGAAVVLGCDQRTAEAILESLVEHQLATVDRAPDAFVGQFHYRFSPLVRVAASSLSQFAAASVPPADANDFWIRRAPSA
ncbi:BTAD domain-containing putative transcriptional regulator [Kutzneria sp. NPDC052558]|uniref:AfsR/SARP family transcriptional regulator n=1 Tax=Kutzneria sp. NPDC052558 TaxID=3364121 RepID=UPI0037C777B7